MKTIKFILLTVAFAVSAAGFAQKNGTAFSFNGKKMTNPGISLIQKNSRENMKKHEMRKAMKKQAAGKIMAKQLHSTSKSIIANLRAQAVVKQRMDSIAGYNGEYYFKAEFTYDEKGNVAEYLYSSRESSDDVWELDYKSVFEYGDNEYQKKAIDYEWYNMNWEGASMTEYTYDKYGNITSEIYTYRDYEEGEDWELSFKEEYTYTADGRLESANNSYWWDGTNWEEGWKTKTDYTFDASGFPTEGIMYKWDFVEEEWIYYQKQTFQFDADENLTLMKIFEWEEDEADWFLYIEDEYTFNADGYLSSYEHSYYNHNSAYSYNSKDEYTYDANGNISANIFTSEGEDYSSTGRYDYTYDLSYSLSDLIFPVFYFEDEDYFGFKDCKNMLKSIKITDEEGSSYTMNYYWSDKPVSNAVIKDENASLIVYPNPTDGQLRITNYEQLNTKVEVFDATGRSVKTESVNAGVIDISRLPAGLYFLKIGKETVKVVKK